MPKVKYVIFKRLSFLCLIFFIAISVIADTRLSPAEMKLSASALEKSNIYERKHIVLIWPEKIKVNWYSESGVQNPAQLADWLEQCYMLSIKWFGIDPNQLHNAGKEEQKCVRLIFVHNGMSDYNFGGKLPRPIIGLRDLRGVGSADWFGWLTHELSHEFFMKLPEIDSSRENSVWHEALCDYLRYWLLKETGMLKAAADWRKLLNQSSSLDSYKGGANIILRYHERKGCQTPGDLLKLIKGKKFSNCFGHAPWKLKQNTHDTQGYEKIQFDGIVDGAGSFTFRDRKIFYEHFTWQYPTQVKINGKAWKDLKKPFVLDFTPDFISARAVVGQGRNTIVLRPYQNRLILFIDDVENSASRYQITIIVKKR